MSINFREVFGGVQSGGGAGRRREVLLLRLQDSPAGDEEASDLAVLIVHSSTSTATDKIVDFPLTGLDPTNYLVSILRRHE